LSEFQIVETDTEKARDANAVSVFPCVVFHIRAKSLFTHSTLAGDN